MIIVVLVSVVIFGGVQSISKVCERLVPIMAVAYAGGCLVILAFNWALVGDALGPYPGMRVHFEGRVRWRRGLRAS